MYTIYIVQHRIIGVADAVFYQQQYITSYRHKKSIAIDWLN